METSYSKTHSRSNIHFNSLPRRSKTVSLALPPLPGTDLALSKEQAAFMVARSKSAMQDPSDLDNDKAQKPRLITFNSPRSSKQVPDMDLLHKMREKDAECTEAPEANATFPFVFLPEASLRREVSQRAIKDINKMDYVLTKDYSDFPKWYQTMLAKVEKKKAKFTSNSIEAGMSSLSLKSNKDG